MEIFGILYAVVGYCIFTYVTFRYFTFICLKCGVRWLPEYDNIAFRAAFIATLPLVVVSLLIISRLFGANGSGPETGIVLAFFAIPALTYWQAKLFATRIRNRPPENGVMEGDDD
jgi:branched-subunit amino acid transport protein AzlD